MSSRYLRCLKVSDCDWLSGGRQAQGQARECAAMKNVPGSVLAGRSAPSQGERHKDRAPYESPLNTVTNPCSRL